MADETPRSILGFGLPDQSLPDRILVPVPVVIDPDTDDIKMVRGQRIDLATGVNIGIDYAHHKLHAGNLYEFTDFNNDLDNAATMEYIVVVPDTTKWPHFTGVINGELETLIEIFRDTTHNLGNVQRVVNTNENYPDNNTTEIYLSAGGGANGDLRFEAQFGISTGGGANKVAGGGASRDSSERILRQNTRYLLRITSLTDNNVVSVLLRWYEQTNRS